MVLKDGYFRVGYFLVVEPLPHLCETLDSTPSTTRIWGNKQKPARIFENLLVFLNLFWQVGHQQQYQGRGSEAVQCVGKLCCCFQGPPMGCVRLAERVVALICCEKLHKIGM